MPLSPPSAEARANPLRRRWLADHWPAAAITALLVLAAVLLEAWVTRGGVWGVATIATGVAAAAALRWGWTAATVALLVGLPAQVLTRATLEQTLAASAAGVVGVSAALWLMRRRGLDKRVERARDVGWLVLALAGVAAPLASGLQAAWLLAEGHAAQELLPWELVARTVVLASTMLLVAVPLLVFVRGTQWPSGRRAVGALVLAAALLGCVLASFATGVRLTPWAPLFELAPHALLIALLIAGGVAMASTVLATALLLVVVLTRQAGAPWATGAPVLADVQLSVAISAVSLLALLLITHASRASAQWRENRREWALDGSRLGVADWHLQHPRDAFVSATWRRLSHHHGQHWTPEHWLAQVHPDDRAPLQAALAAVTAGEEGRTVLELRLPDDDLGGEEPWRWFEATLLVIERSGDGRPQRLLATVSDVHERHTAQQRERLTMGLFQHLHEGLLITDEHLRALDINPAYAQILGVARDDVLGAVPSLLRANPPDPLARQQRAAMFAALAQQGSWKGELLERRGNGELCTLQATVSAVPTAAQDARYHVLVISDITEQRLQREKLERQAHFDELTRLPNRARLSSLLSEAMRAADRDGYLLAVCYLDLDHFKPVNDRHGHAAGDRLLVELATRLRSALRTRENWVDVAARLGGDEFVLLLRAGTLEEARLAVERVLRVVAQPYQLGPEIEPVQVSASMGATVYPVDRSDADTLLRHADHAMYGAKQSGRNGYLLFDPEHRRRTEERVMAIGRVQEALDRSEFVLFYQPKVDMRSGVVLGFEALLRWDHPQQGLIAPAQFLPLIENTGLSSRVGDWVLAQALEHLSAWRRTGLDISVSVNISARHLQEPDFAQRLSELLARYTSTHPKGLAPSLELEMLETAAHADIEATSALMARCRGTGVRFALDDFGTGYSTLTYLKRLPVDTLKIDRSFVHHMLDDTQDRAIVEGVIGLARTFGCTVVAEGVESPAQARALLDMQCTIGQGTGIAAPMPVGQIVPWVREYRGMFALASAAGGAPAAHGGGAESV